MSPDASAVVEPSLEPDTKPVVPAPPRYRYRLRFSKRGPLRWVGHLDLQACWERTLRRAHLQMVHSKGFHPRPRMVFASALPLGCTSEAELVDLWLGEELTTEVLLTRLQKVAPPGMTIYEAETIDLQAPTITVQLERAAFTVTLPPLAVEDGQGLARSVEAMLAAKTLPRERRGKGYDLRPLIDALQHDDETLQIVLSAREGATGRVEEVLDVLGLDPADCRIERTALLLTPLEVFEAAREAKAKAKAEAKADAATADEQKEASDDGEAETVAEVSSAPPLLSTPS